MALTTEEIQKYSADAQKYSAELADLSAQNGVKVQDIKGNDAGELLKASGAGLATGAAIGAAASVAFPPFAPLIVAAGAIIGAIAGFFAKFRFGPSAESLKLAAEFDQMNKTIHEIVLTVPQPHRAQLMTAILDGLRTDPGALPFCLGGGEAGTEGGGCVNTSMTGLRNAAASVDQQVKDLLAKAQAETAAATRGRTAGRILLGAGALAAVGYGIYHFGGRSGR